MIEEICSNDRAFNVSNNKNALEDTAQTKVKSDKLSTISRDSSTIGSQ